VEVFLHEMLAPSDGIEHPPYADKNNTVRGRNRYQKESGHAGPDHSADFLSQASLFILVSRRCRKQ
jgi:hypothetical protein